MIEQFAAILAAIIFKKSGQDYDSALEKINEAYNGLLHLDPDVARLLSAEQIIADHTYNNILDGESIEVAACLLFQEADVLELRDGKNELSRDYYQKALALFLALLEQKNGDGKHRDYVENSIVKLDSYEIESAAQRKIYEYFLQNEKYGKAEDRLYYLLESGDPGIKDELSAFYAALLEKDDLALEKGNLPRSEIEEGRLRLLT